MLAIPTQGRSLRRGYGFPGARREAVLVRAPSSRNPMRARRLWRRSRQRHLSCSTSSSGRAAESRCRANAAFAHDVRTPGAGAIVPCCRCTSEPATIRGAIRHLAFSTHSVEIALMFIELGVFDWAMFSINPMYDYADASQYGNGGAEDRMRLYRAFESAGIGVSVMKAFAGGQLLDAARRSRPFRHVLFRDASICGPISCHIIRTHVRIIQE